MAAQNHNLLHYLLTILYFTITRLVSSALSIFVGLIGVYILSLGKEPWGILVGLPLTLIGGGFAINSLATVFFVIANPTYNHGMCPFCNKESKD